MSKAQNLLKNRKEVGSDVEIRSFEKVFGADSLDSYYEHILSYDEIEKALDEYKGHYDEITAEFIEKTRLQGSDIGFLIVATALQCIRIHLIEKITKIEKANTKGGKEDKIHSLQEKVLGKFSSGDISVTEPLYASLEKIIATRGVPYDAQASFSEEIRSLHLFKGANHRFTTLGHDPLLGLIFGTANILTNTISLNHKVLIDTYNVHYDNLKNPKISYHVSFLVEKMLQSVIYQGTLRLAIIRYESVSGK